MDVRVALVNPPGARRYLRDYYCSTVSKAGYYWPPIDLLVQSGILAERHPLTVVDAIAEDLPWGTALDRLVRSKPEVVFFLASALSWREDYAFALEARRRTGARLATSGEVSLGTPEAALAGMPEVEAALLDFTSSDLLAYLSGERAGLRQMAWRTGDAIAVRRERTAHAWFSYPIPRYDLFPMHRYSMPLQRHAPLATVLTNYGCPFACAYCNSGRLTLGFARRRLDNLLEELRSLHALGIRQVWLRDMTFGVDRDYTLELCAALEREGMDLAWNCYARADLLDARLLGAMRRAGCYLVMLGIESAQESLLRSFDKAVPIESIRETLGLCSREGMQVGGHFVLGLPGESEADVRRTVELALELDLAFASFNAYLPRGGAPLQSPSSLPPERVQELCRWAARRFHLRPKYLLTRVLRARTLQELSALARHGWGMIERPVAPALRVPRPD